MQSERKILADINQARDGWIQVTLSGDGAADLTEAQIEAALSAQVQDVAESAKEFAASARAMKQLADHGPDDDLRDAMREMSHRMFRVLAGLSPSAIPAQVKDVAGWQLLYEDGNVSRDLYSEEAAENKKLNSSDIVGIRPLYAAAPAKQEG